MIEIEKDGQKFIADIHEVHIFTGNTIMMLKGGMGAGAPGNTAIQYQARIVYKLYDQDGKPAGMGAVAREIDPAQIFAVGEDTLLTFEPLKPRKVKDKGIEDKVTSSKVNAFKAAVEATQEAVKSINGLKKEKKV